MVGRPQWRLVLLLSGQADLLGLRIAADAQMSPSSQTTNCSSATNVTLCHMAETLWMGHQGNASVNESGSMRGSMSAPSGSRTSAGSQSPSARTQAPNNYTRDATFYDWCDCGTGLADVTFWPNNDWERRVTLTPDTIKHVNFGINVRRVHWICSGMDSSGSERFYRWRHISVSENTWLSLLLHSEEKDVESCSSTTGRLHWNTWTPVSYASSVPFVSGTEGYPCFKIPAMLVTQSGAVLAFSEARTPNCDDFARTDLVYKRSTDGGMTWSAVKQVVQISGDSRLLGECGKDLVVGNAAPVQLRQNSTSHPGRILLPYTRNNFEIWITHSDDDGLTWSGDHQIPNVTHTDATPDCNRTMSYFGIDSTVFSFRSAGAIAEWVYSLCKDKSPFDRPSWVDKLTGPWQFIGTGPPGSLQLRSGRLLVPCYRSYIRGVSSEDAAHGLPVGQLYNNFGLGFVFISDDDGDTWRLGSDWPVSQGADENQMVELSDGSVLVNSRALATGSPQMRLQARSYDEGETFTATAFAPQLPQPFNGCQGSTISGPPNTVYVATPDPPTPTSIAQKLVDAIGCTVRLDGRNRLTAWKSTDGGASYPQKTVIDPGLSAQTSLQFSGGSLVVLQEQADPLPKTPANLFQEVLVENLRVLTPTRFVFREVSFDAPPSPTPSPFVSRAGHTSIMSGLGLLLALRLLPGLVQQHQ